MDIRSQHANGIWSEILGRVKERWAQLTDEDLLGVEGNLELLASRIQVRTGQAREVVCRTLDEIVQRAQPVADRLVEGSGPFLRRAAERYEEVRRWTVARPGQAMAVFFGLGLGLGLILGRSRR